MAKMTDINTTVEDERSARFDVLVTELRPMLRRAHPWFSEARLMETAISIAACRLSGGNMVSAFLE
jgi:hypothetical protein